MARRYDASTTTFSPEGRLHQVKTEQRYLLFDKLHWLIGLVSADFLIQFDYYYYS